MKLLMDTHAFIWWDNDTTRLSPQAIALFQDPANTLLLSVASAWEMQIKIQLGKLQLPLGLEDMIAGQQSLNRLEVLPVNLAHVLALDNLPSHHKDPFDRLLIAQAIVEDAVLVSRDPIFSQYPVNVQW